ncbi:cinnamoyl-CoA reductase 1-like [Nymphaea colorata]|nr:cinnamoyl-CoA reductase 1-like [Nymphaea colorata]
MEYTPKEVAVMSGGAVGGGRLVVCVTGAGGYIASWLVKILLSKGYTVHVPLQVTSSLAGDKKNEHLKNLENSEKLVLFKADLLNYGELYSAIVGCSGVFHVASPVPLGSVPNPEKELVEPAVDGTLNVLKASADAEVKKIVFVSSTAAIFVTPNPPENNFYDEECWSDTEYCRVTENWYCVSKTLAEKRAWECAKERGLELVTVCPTLNLGPMLQNPVNASSLFLVKLLRGDKDTVPNAVRGIVDVRDVAEALVLVYEKQEASGRYLCSAHCVRTCELVDILKRMYPNYKYPKEYTASSHDDCLSSKKLQNLGWHFRPLEETLADSVESFRGHGLLE